MCPAFAWRFLSTVPGGRSYIYFIQLVLFYLPSSFLKSRISICWEHTSFPGPGFLWLALCQVHTLWSCSFSSFFPSAFPPFPCQHLTLLHWSYHFILNVVSWEVRDFALGLSTHAWQPAQPRGGVQALALGRLRSVGSPYCTNLSMFLTLFYCLMLFRVTPFPSDWLNRHTLHPIISGPSEKSERMLFGSDLICMSPPHSLC